MTSWRFDVVVVLFCTLLLVGCSRNKPEPRPLAGPPQTGTIYSLNDGEGGFRVGKVVATEDDVVFVHLFANRWSSRPSPEALKAIKNPLPVGYFTETFAGMNPALLQQGSVSVEEEETYAAWKKSNTGLF